MDKRLKVFIFCILSLIIVLPLQVNSEKELQNEGTIEKEVQVVDTIKTEVQDDGPNKTVIQKIGVEEKQSEDSIQDEKGIFELLKSGFMAQVSLSEKGRSLKEVALILEPYFSDSFIEIFLNENIVEEGGQYVTYGSDFAPYYIPFYSYSDKTRVVNHNDSIFVVEFFPPVTEGPVNYDGHYQAVEIERLEKGLKVTKIWYENIPDAVLNF
jgi:Protein of unknown function (DUF3993)